MKCNQPIIHISRDNDLGSKANKKFKHNISDRTKRTRDQTFQHDCDRTKKHRVFAR
jgi:hypothetical protein